MNGEAGQSPRREPTRAAGRPLPQDPTALGVGAEIDDFLILDELGEGAFAKVYLANQTSLRRTVALKVFTDPSREARTLARVDHPNIVRVHDQRRAAAAGLELLYMEYVPGGTLEAVVTRVASTPPATRTGALVLEVIDAALARRDDRPPLDSMLRARLARSTWPEAVCVLGAHMAVALDFAHSRGVLHRDMKPANVLLDETGRAKLADFNISAASDEDPDEDDEAVGGTLPYMAPEQVRAISPWHEGGAADLDARTDIFGLGVVLWELLTGALPFPEPPEGTGMQAVIEHLVATRSAGVDERTIAAAAEHAPPMVVQALSACLAPDPAARPQSGAEIRRLLEWCLDPRLHELFAPRAGGWFCYRSWLCRIPIAGLVGLGLVPNALL
ncbi:MAG: serine/threonine-protein kinase, partial [Planctomycetota bacterium]|nr:serine/threonine-protein kinase [Planctomycetota bacterium]